MIDFFQENGQNRRALKTCDLTPMYESISKFGAGRSLPPSLALSYLSLSLPLFLSFSHYLTFSLFPFSLCLTLYLSFFLPFQTHG